MKNDRGIWKWRAINRERETEVEKEIQGEVEKQTHAEIKR